MWGVIDGWRDGTVYFNCICSGRTLDYSDPRLGTSKCSTEGSSEILQLCRSPMSASERDGELRLHYKVRG